MTFCNDIALTAGSDGSSQNDDDASESPVLGRGPYIEIEDADRDGVFDKAAPED